MFDVIYVRLIFIITYALEFYKKLQERGRELNSPPVAGCHTQLLMADRAPHGRQSPSWQTVSLIADSAPHGRESSSWSESAPHGR